MTYFFNKRDRTNFRIASGTLAVIDSASQRKAEKVSRNSSIAEVIQEGLAREGASNGRIEPGRQGNG